MIEKLHETVNILDEQFAKWLPHKVFVAYSGGRDSAVVLDIAIRHNYKRLAGVMAIETGLAADGWRDMVRGHCDALAVNLEFVSGCGWEWYEEDVMRYGFSYTPGQHTIYYRMLKERAIYRHLKASKRGRRDRIVYLTGVRRSESAKRAKTPVSYRDGSRITVNPILHWSERDVERYLRFVADWWSSPFYATVGASGDCLCGWTCKHSAESVEENYPIIGARLVELSDRAESAGLWRYGVRGDSCKPSNEDKMPTDSLCSDCDK